MAKISTEIKDLKRLEKILLVLFEEGLGYYLTQAKLHVHLPFHKRIKPKFSVNSRKQQAIRLRRSFEKLGGTFVKLGQLLSLRPDLVPQEYVEEFEKLQDQVEPFNFSQVKKIIETDLGRPLKSIFREFTAKPFASASVAQVHKAVLKNGQAVAVKVQRPEIKENLDADLDILFYIAEKLEIYSPKIKSYHPSKIVREFALWSRKELDFKLEALNALHLKETSKKNHWVKIPLIYQDYSSQKVITMEIIKGIKLDDLQGIKKYHLKTKTILQRYFNAILEQALLHGFFHADPHPANTFVLKNGQISFLDFGIIGQLKDHDRRTVINFIKSIPEKNSEKSISIFLSLARKIPLENLDGFKERTKEILEDVYQHDVSERSIGNALYEIISLGGRYNIEFDPNHVLMAKALYQAEGLVFKLDPEFKIAEALEKFRKNYLNENISPKHLISKAKSAWSENKDLILDFPEHLQNIIRNLEKPQQEVQISPDQWQELEDKVEASNRHRSTGLMVVVLFVATMFFFYAEGRNSFLGIPFSDLLLMLTLIMIVYLLVKKFRRNKNGRDS